MRVAMKREEREKMRHKELKNQEWLPGWKVVGALSSLAKQKQFISATLHLQTRGCLFYQKGKITTPLDHCGPIAVFAEYDDAESFVATSLLRLSRYRIQPCAYVISGRKTMWIHQNLYMGSIQVSNQIIAPLSDLPVGTCLANQVMLLPDGFFAQ